MNSCFQSGIDSKSSLNVISQLLLLLLPYYKFCRYLGEPGGSFEELHVDV
jgi:hypothetical protein